jgi:serine/threonine protein kinase
MILKNSLCGGDINKFIEFYDIQFELAKGGFGNVFKGYDKRNMCNCAIKVMPLEN